MIEIKVDTTIFKTLDNLGKPYKLFDTAIRDGANFARNIFINTTNVLDGVTKKSWQEIKKDSDSEYSVSNTNTTSYSGIPVVQILEEGRGEVFPIKKKILFIPLSKKGRGKKLGEKIPKDFEYGVDYVLSKKARAFKGTQFISKGIQASASKFSDFIEREFLSA